MPDLITDMDANNLGINLDLGNVKSLSKLFEDYFLDITNNNSREEKFIASVATQSGISDESNEDKFVSITLDILKLNSDGSEASSGSLLGDL